jgi:hypothetical protein
MQTTTTQSATYVYGIAAADAFRNGHAPLSVPGIGGRGAAVRTIPFEDLVAVVSDVPGFKFDLTRENLLEHQRVLDEVVARGDVLPFSFGTVAASDDEVRELLLEGGFDALKEQLASVRGCVELQLKAFWNQDQLFAEIAEENDEVRALRDAILDLSEADATSARITLGQLAEAEIELKSTWDADRILEVLEPLAVEIRVSANLNDTMLLNAACLVERSREKEFDEAVEVIAQANANRMAFSYVGPLPPYSFIDLAFQSEGW